MKDLKISFCTISMNRLHHLQHTLIRNIRDNESYKNIEFILLDYNSSDEIYNHVQRNFSKFIESGKLTYYRTDQPASYNVSHSRNMVFKLATGDIICNIDADNFTGKDFASYVNNCFLNNKDIFLTTHTISGVKNDVVGRICVRKEDFLSINGYDERMLHYGFEDIDFANRLQTLGRHLMQINSSRFLNAIEHSNLERMSNFSHTKEHECLIVRYISPCESELILLFDGNKYAKARIINNNIFNVLDTSAAEKRDTQYMFSISEPKWEEGKWEKQEKKIHFYDGSAPKFTLHMKSKGRYLCCGRNEYYSIPFPHVRETVLFFYNQLCNRVIMEENARENNTKVNPNSFGKGSVTKNFETGHIIL